MTKIKKSTTTLAQRINTGKIFTLASTNKLFTPLLLFLLFVVLLQFVVPALREAGFPCWAAERAAQRVLKFIKNLNHGYYTLHFYPYIQNFVENDFFILKDNNDNLVLYKDNSTYKSWMSLILNKDKGGKYSSDICLTCEIFGLISERLQYLTDEALECIDIDIDIDNNNFLVIYKVNESQFRKNNYRKGYQFVYDMTSYSFIDDKTISIYNPIIVNNDDKVNSEKSEYNISVDKENKYTKENNKSILPIFFWKKKMDTDKSNIFTKQKRSFSTNGANYTNNKLVINSSPEKIVFENGKAVLMLPPLKPFFKNRIKEEEISKYGLDKFLQEFKAGNISHFDWKKFLQELEDGNNTDLKDYLLEFENFYSSLLKVFYNLKQGFYILDFYYYISYPQNVNVISPVYINDPFAKDSFNFVMGSYGYTSFVHFSENLNGFMENRFVNDFIFILLLERLRDILKNESLKNVIDMNKDTLLVITKTSEYVSDEEYYSVQLKKNYVPGLHVSEIKRFYSISAKPSHSKSKQGNCKIELLPLPATDVINKEELLETVREKNLLTDVEEVNVSEEKEIVDLEEKYVTDLVKTLDTVQDGLSDSSLD